LTPCLLNCSNHGQCFITNNNTFVCECTQNYTGSRCHIDKRLCSSYPCLHNAVCADIIDNQGDYSFNCSCPPNHFGIHCEKQVDLCANETCSNNGVCSSKNLTAHCECFPMFSGEKCEIESNEMKAIKATIEITSILAILILISFYCLFVLVDICNLYANRKKKLFKKHKEDSKILIYKFIYKN
jgi:hypothetical protein